MSRQPFRKKVSLFLMIGIVAFAGWLVYGMVIDEDPQFFSLNNSQGEYRVTKGCPMGQGWQERAPIQGEAYCVEYKGPGVFMNDQNGNTNFFRITVGTSRVELAAFIGKKVKNIKGKFTSSSKQCIQNTCSDIGGPWAVLNTEAPRAFTTVESPNTSAGAKVPPKRECFLPRTDVRRIPRRRD